MYTQTEVSDILQISEGILTSVSKKRKIEKGNPHKSGSKHSLPSENSEADVVIAACTCL